MVAAWHYFLMLAAQFTTTVMGVSADSTGLVTRNRWPSRVTSYACRRRKPDCGEMSNRRTGEDSSSFVPDVRIDTDIASCRVLRKKALYCRLAIEARHHPRGIPSTCPKDLENFGRTHPRDGDLFVSSSLPRCARDPAFRCWFEARSSCFSASGASNILLKYCCSNQTPPLMTRR
jgi:hypothetical protein